MVLMLKRMYGEGELKENWLSQVNLEGRLLNHRMCVCVCHSNHRHFSKIHFVLLNSLAINSINDVR